MIEAVTLAITAVLLAASAAGFWRLWRGPTAFDRLVAVQSFGTTAIAVLLLLAESMGIPGARDVALIFALLAALTAEAFVARGDAASAGRPR